MSTPYRVLVRHEATQEEIDAALATIKALVPSALVVLIAAHLDGMRLERAMGDLRINLHMYQGEIRSCSFERATEWKRHEPPAAQGPQRAKS